MSVSIERDFFFALYQNQTTLLEMYQFKKKKRSRFRNKSSTIHWGKSCMQQKKAIKPKNGHMTQQDKDVDGSITKTFT